MPKFSPVSHKTLAKVFGADGFRCVRIEGDHMEWLTGSSAHFEFNEMEVPDALVGG